MARTLLRGIAVAAGTGLAYSRMGMRQSSPEPLVLEQMIERLDRLEARVALAEARPPAEAPAESSADVADLRASIARIDERLAAQARDIELLRIRADEAETLAEAEIRVIERRFQEVAAALPAEIETVVTQRVEHLRHRLHLEIQESVTTALAGFEHSIDARISNRMSAIDRQLLDLSSSLGELKSRSAQTDINLQKLIQAVECLCDQRDPALASQTPLQESPAPEPIFFDLPFEKQMKQALAESSDTLRPVRQDDDARVPLAHL